MYEDLRVRANSQRWYRLRQTGLGASDIAGVMGWSPYTSPTRLYYEKTGALSFEPGTERMEWGHRAERMILDKFREDNPFGGRWRYGRMLRRVEDPWALATPDAYTDLGDEGVVLVEAKNVNNADTHAWGRGEADIPLHYRCQVLWQMFVTDAPRAYVPVLFGGSRYRLYVIERDDDDIRVLVHRAREFWRMVERREPPLPDGMTMTTKTLRSVYGVDREQVAEVPADLVALYNRARRHLATAQRFADQVENRVRVAVGEAQRAAVNEDGLRRLVATRSSWEEDRVDVAGLRRDHPELVDKYTNTVARQRLTWKG